MRYQDWEKRLLHPQEGVVARALVVPFQWGAHDCFTFGAIAWVEAVREGVSPCRHLIGTYDSEDSAQSVLNDEGCEDTEALLAKYFHRVIAPETGEVWVQGADRGDIGIVRVGEKKIIVGISGSHCHAPGVRCLHHAPRSLLVASFMVC